MTTKRPLAVGIAFLVLAWAVSAGVACEDSLDEGVGTPSTDPEAAAELAEIQYDEYLEEQAQRDALYEAEQLGYEEGYDEGYTIGYDDGYLDGCENLGRTLVNQGILDWYRC